MSSTNRTGCCCGPAGCGTICVAVANSCDGSDVSSATVTVKKSGVFVSSCTTASGQVVSVAVTGSGTGYSSVTPPAVTFSGGGGSGASATASVFGGNVTAIKVIGGGSGYTSNPTVTVAPPSSGSAATATATIGSRCCANVFSAGTTGQYTVDLAATGYTSRTGISVGAVACTGSSVTPQSLTLTPTTATLKVCVSGACSATLPLAAHCGTNYVPGATVTVSSGGVVVTTGTADSGGYAEFPGLTPGVTYAVTASLSPRMVASTPVSVTLATCGSSTVVTPAIASGYHCYQVRDAFGAVIAFGDCYLPLADTLFLTDPVYGAVTLTWTATSVLPGGGERWEGTKSITFTACPPTCASAAATGLWSLSGTGGNSLLARYLTTPASDPCPDGSAGAFWTGGNAAGVTGYTCPPAATLTWVGDGGGCMYDGTPKTYGITE